MLGVPDHLFECLLEQRYPSEHEAKPKKTEAGGLLWAGRRWDLSHGHYIQQYYYYSYFYSYSLVSVSL